MVSMKVKKTEKNTFQINGGLKKKAEKDQEKKLFGESNIEMGLAIDIHIMKCDKIANECSNKQISYL